MERIKEVFKKQTSKIFIGGLFLTLAFLMVGVGGVEKIGANDGSSITITSPNGGGLWELNSPHLITWTQTNIDKVNLYACYGVSSSTCELIVSSLETSGNTGSYSWNIPSDFLERADYKISVVAWQTGVGTDSDKSNEVFTIGGNTTSTDYDIQLLSQTTDEVWEVGKSYVIQWSNSNPDYIKEMNVSLATVDGTKWHTFSSVDSIEGQTDYSMTVVAPTMDGSDYKIKLRGEKAYDGYLTETVSSDGFINLLSSVPASSITVTYPNGGEKWEAGKAYIIVWYSTGYDKVRIYVGCEGYSSGAIMDVSSGATGGSYIYVVPANWAAQTQCKVQVSENLSMLTNITDGVNSDMSNNYFSIVESSASSITVTSPSSDDSLEIGKQYQIKWNTTGLSSDEKLRIIIYTESKQRSHTITESVNNTGSYNWTAEFPGLVIQPNQKFYIYIDNSNIFDYSETFYLSEAEVSIDKSITVISPNGGEELKIGKQYLIKWNATEDVEHVTIALNKNGVYAKNLIGNIKNYGSTSWTPDLSLEVGDDYKIRITNPDDSSVYDESDSYFSISNLSNSTCLPDGTLIKIPGNPKIYVIKNCEKQWIKNAEEFQRGGYKWGNVQEVNIEVINMYVEHLTVNLLKGAHSSKIYRVINGKRLWIPTAAAFNAQGLKWDDVQNVSETNVNQYPVIKLVKLVGSSEVYYLTNSGFKKHIPTAEVFNSYNNKWEDIVEISADELNTFNDVQLIKADGDFKVYKLENGVKRWIKTANAFNRLGLSWTEISPVNKIEINAYPVGMNIE
ncbi:MAG: hypothetical protein KAQ87_00710 [Candidatus Pacebacteria bacterium]|nr:hypothetical protein [Candidatus Paceibacterota bacterium]